MERQVLHINVANFFAAVEELEDPSLRGEPFIIALEGAPRAVVLDVSEKAFREGIRKGDPLGKARKMKGIAILEPRYGIYSTAERELYKFLRGWAPVVEQVSGGHLFLDISGTGKIFGNPVDHAARIKRETLERLGISPIVGHAGNRLVSKVATRVVKPDGFVSVIPGDERVFLQHQEVSLLPGVGHRLSELLGMLGIREMGGLAALSDDQTTAVFGRKGNRLRDSARGIDFTPVSAEQALARKIRQTRTLDSDTNDPEELEGNIFSLAEDAGIILRQNNMLCRGVEVTVSYTDGLKREGRSVLSGPSFCDRDFFEASREVLRRIADRRVRVRSLSLALTRLHEGDLQLDLFVPESRVKAERLQESLDAIRQSFGRDAVSVGYTLKRKKP